jgi:hypothetical protein
MRRRFCREIDPAPALTLTLFVLQSCSIVVIKLKQAVLIFHYLPASDLGYHEFFPVKTFDKFIGSGITPERFSLRITFQPGAC